VDRIPDCIDPQELSDYLEVMTRAVFQTGVSWKQIADHWDAYKSGFADFNVRAVAMFDDTEIDRLMHTDGVMHSTRKIRATIKNAKAMLELEAAHGGFENYLRSFTDYAKAARDLKKRFTFMGEMNAWYFLFRVRRPVPKFEGWVTTIPGDHPRMKEMVDRARAAGRSSEV
jgi:3-methyladenine DNA glycosylase Tag